VRAELTRLQAAEFLYEARLFPDLEYTFKHALTHEVMPARRPPCLFMLHEPIAVEVAWQLQLWLLSIGRSSERIHRPTVPATRHWRWTQVHSEAVGELVALM